MGSGVRSVGVGGGPGGVGQAGVEAGVGSGVGGISSCVAESGHGGGAEENLEISSVFDFKSALPARELLNPSS